MQTCRIEINASLILRGLTIHVVNEFRIKINFGNQGRRMG